MEVYRLYRFQKSVSANKEVLSLSLMAGLLCNRYIEMGIYEIEGGICAKYRVSKAFYGTIKFEILCVKQLSFFFP